MVGKAEYMKVMAALVTTAFALIAALSWQAAIQAIFIEVLGTATSIPATLSYAIIVTIIAVLASVWIARIASRATAEEMQAGKEEAQAVEMK
jgi:TRAP-type C4-dicarboxylate transport system permease small subunit